MKDVNKRYIYKNKNTYYILKNGNYYGSFRTIDDAIREKKILEQNGWDEELINELYTETEPRKYNYKYIDINDISNSISVKTEYDYSDKSYIHSNNNKKQSFQVRKNRNKKTKQYATYTNKTNAYVMRDFLENRNFKLQYNYNMYDTEILKKINIVNEIIKHKLKNK